MRGLLPWLAALAALSASPRGARADDARRDQAQRLYVEGKAAYERQDYAAAYERFRGAYLASSEPDLLYDMASALDGAGRPHEAAESLRAYLRARPQAPERPAVEERIRALEEAQRLIDHAQPRPERAEAPSAATLKPVAAAEREHERPRRRGLWIGLGVGAAVVVVAAVALGLAFGLSPRDAAVPGSGLGDFKVTF